MTNLELVLLLIASATILLFFFFFLLYQSEKKLKKHYKSKYEINKEFDPYYMHQCEILNNEFNFLNKEHTQLKNQALSLKNELTAVTDKLETFGIKYLGKILENKENEDSIAYKFENIINTEPSPPPPSNNFCNCQIPKPTLLRDYCQQCGKNLKK